jgi:hypothetical protein
MIQILIGLALIVIGTTIKVNSAEIGAWLDRHFAKKPPA